MNYTNPLYKRKSDDKSPTAQPDPYMINANGQYHLYCTNDAGVAYYYSDDIVNWTYGGLVYSEAGRKGYWAPSVIACDNKYYMYVSNMPCNSFDTHEQAIRVAESDKPQGPFVFVKQMLPPFSIDAHVVNYKNNLYMYYSVNDCSSERVGTCIVVDKLKDAYTVEGLPRIALKPTLDEEIFMKDRFKKGQHWHTIEGAFYFNHNKKHYLMYSGACYMLPTYHIAYAVAEGDVDDLRDLVFTKALKNNKYNPLLCSATDVEGMGHNSCIMVDDTYYCVYHGRENDGKTYNYDVRTFRIDPLTFTPTGSLHITRKPTHTLNHSNK